MIVRSVLGKSVVMAVFIAGIYSCSQEETAPTIANKSNGKGDVQASQVVPPAPQVSAALIQTAIDNPDRPAADREDDAARKPAAVLGFAGIAPGMSVFELEAGGGYYTELFSSIVGKTGKVWMHNPVIFDEFLGDSLTNRLANNRLANVELTRTLFDGLEAADNSVDVVTWFLGPHELYYTPSNGVSFGDPKMVYAEINRVLKPGGHFIVLDHAAMPGSPQTTGGKTHRIDPAIVTALAVEAGLQAIEKSNALRNPEDDYTLIVFDPKVRRKTDRFLMKFKKPE
jgi:predicted methyltransferase